MSMDVGAGVSTGAEQPAIKTTAATMASMPDLFMGLIIAVSHSRSSPVAGQD